MKMARMAIGFSAALLMLAAPAFGQGEKDGVGQVIVTGFDTLADEDRFFSHRRRTLAQRAGQVGPIGHQISVIRTA